MNSKLKTITTNVDVESIDIPTMLALSDDDYRDFVHRAGLVFVDHHDVLRSSPAGYPIAVTQEQLDILIKELGRLRDKLLPRSEL